jgi:hypothetical protein
VQIPVSWNLGEWLGVCYRPVVLEYCYRSSGLEKCPRYTPCLLQLVSFRGQGLLQPYYPGCDPGVGVAGYRYMVRGGWNGGSDLLD